MTPDRRKPIGKPVRVAPALSDAPGGDEMSSPRTVTPMAAERRRRHRVAGPFEVTWSATSGYRRVHIADFSPDGCFVEDIVTPAVGERVTLMLRVPGGDPIDVAGCVTYVTPPLGFAVVFEVDERVASELDAAVRRVSPRA